ncbi:MAG: DUF4129 domain-containing transglutaminase family protein [Dehalococcoidia bacterium]
MTTEKDIGRGALFRALRRVRAGASWTADHVSTAVRQLVRGPVEGWPTFFLLVICVLVAVWIVRSVQWVPTPGVYSIALCAAVLGLVLAKMRFNRWRLAIAGLLLGLFLIFYQLTSLADGPTRPERLAEIGSRLLVWWQALVGGGTSSDTLPFTFFVLLVSWLVGFLSSWFLFRRHSVWGTLLPGGVVVVASLMNVSSGEQIFYLHLYLFVAFLLGARLFSLERRLDWKQRGVQHLPPDAGVRLPDGFWLAMVIVLVTSLIPLEAARVDPLAAVWDRLSSPARAMSEEFARVLVGVSVGRPDSGHSFGPTQPFEGSATVREDPALIVEAPFPLYLRARSYDVYTHRGWETGPTRFVAVKSTSEQGIDAEFRRLQQVDMTVRDLPALAAGAPIYLGGYPVAISIGYQLEVPDFAHYRISLANGAPESSAATDSLPTDLQEAVQQLRELSAASGGVLTESEITSGLPGDVTVISWEGAGEVIEEITVARRAVIPVHALSVCADDPVSAGGSYQATVHLSAAGEGELRTAGTEYPGWLLDRYVQLPGNMPQRVIELARELAADAENPYEKAAAIRDYLRTLDYTLEIEAPPDGVDGVDYFLFDLEKGYCQYFASAMTVLLRACGVPSRLAVGYGPGELLGDHGADDMIGLTPGEWEERMLTFIVRDSHSWCEVFFPGYGWIPFEPTPSFPPVIRGSPSLAPPDDADEGSGGSADETEGGGVLPGDSGGPESVGARYVWLLAVSIVLGLVGMALWLGWRRFLGRVSEPRAAYARMGYLATLIGLRPRETLTPYEYGRRLSLALPEMSTASDTIVGSYVRACYGQADVSDEEKSGIAEAWLQIRNGLLRSALHRLLPRKARLSKPAP